MWYVVFVCRYDTINWGHRLHSNETEKNNISTDVRGEHNIKKKIAIHFQIQPRISSIELHIQIGIGDIERRTKWK